MLEREAIYQRVWGYAMAHGDRSVDVFIRKLRQKLEKRSPGWRYIHTHFGVGYRFDPEAVGGAWPRRRGGRRRGRRRPAAGFTSSSQQLYGRVTGGALLRGRRRGSSLVGCSRSVPRSTRHWSTVGR